MSDNTFIKGFRTNMAYFPESVDYGETFAVTKNNAYKVGGKVKSLNWTARQNILKTSSIGDGRNYKQQLYGTYDANGSINWEVSDLSFLRFASGDIAKFGNGDSSTSPYIIVDSELTGLDSDAASKAALSAGDSKNYSKVRIRPFSILAYDRENNGSADYNESVDLIKGALMTDINLSASIGTPLVANTGFVARKINFKRYLDPTDVPDFTSTTPFEDNGSAYINNPKASFDAAQEAPLMFHQGKVSYGGNTLALVQSFNISMNGNYRTYREVGDRFIKLPTTGMRNFTCTLNLLFNLPAGEGKPTGGETSILGVIKNYLGYKESDDFSTTKELSPQDIATPPEPKTINLKFVGTTLSGNEKGTDINLYNAVPEGFGHPIQLENGMVEIPVTFNVLGYPFNRAGDGSYTGHDGSSGTAYANINPIFAFWTS